MSRLISRRPLRLSGTSPLAMRSARPFDDRGLAGAGLADQHRVVLGAAGEDLDRAADLLVAADHRIELAVARRLGEVAGVLLHRVVGFPRRSALCAGAPAAQRPRSRLRAPSGSTLAALSACPAAVVVASASASSSRSTVTKLSPALLGDLLGLVEHAHGVVVEPRRRLRPAARHRRDLGQRLVDLADRDLRIAAGALDQPGGHALAVLEQRLEQVLGRDPLVVQPDRHGLRRLQEALGAVGELLEIHQLPRVNPPPNRWCNAPGVQAP